MKQLTFLLFTFGIIATLTAQNCEIPNPSFEVWEDVTDDFDEDLDPETFILPSPHVPLIRLFAQAFVDFLGEAFDIEKAETFLGMIRTEDSTDGNYAMQLQIDSSLTFADDFVFFDCRQIPKALLLDVKHVGNNPDTLSTAIQFVDEIDIFSTDESLIRASGISEIIVNGDTDFETIEIPISDNNLQVIPDTAFINIIFSGDPSNPKSHYFIVDNLRFDFGSSTHQTNLNEAVKIFPMPFSNQLNFENENDQLVGNIYSMKGELLKTISVKPGHSNIKINESLDAGNYLLELIDTNRNLRSTYNIIKG